MNTYKIATVAFLCAAIASPAWAQKGQDHGNNGKDHGKGAASDHRGGPPQDDRGPSVQQRGPATQNTFVIVDRDRTVVSTYYRDEFSRGNCPPGLAKKDNGCLPPGQARKLWAVNQPLPPTVTYYPLPPVLYGQLTPPPSGYQYVRVVDDVLLMQTDNRSVVNLVVNLH
jgi:Ni/Co efflux regulator RcnB